MKKVIQLIVIILCSAQLYSAEPLVRFYLNDGSSKQYNLNDIDSMNILDKRNNYVMRIHYHDTLVAYYPTEIIGSIKFEKDSATRDILNVYIFTYPKPYVLSSIDSVIFYIDQYQPLTIGSQVWMLKNLNVDHYRNGDSIPEVTYYLLWKKSTIGAWCFYRNDPTIGLTYGKLYNWYAVNDPRGLAPIGWHIPNNEEFDQLYNSLGGSYVAGGKLKETGTSHWEITNTGATNESGFTALPSGYRSDDGTFNYSGYFGYFWTASISSEAEFASSRVLHYYSESADYIDLSPITNGFSVRCIKGALEKDVRPQIIKIFPKTAKIGDTLSISGRNFDSNIKNKFVSFSGINANEYYNWNDSVIKVKIPKGAINGRVWVSIDTLKSNEINFKIIPQIYSINPTTIKIGDSLFIFGDGFGNVKGNNSVSFSYLFASSIIQWSDTLIIVKVPSGFTSGYIWVISNELKSNEIYLKVTYDTVTIGSQVWMLKNLDVVRYRNGDPIEYKKTQTGAYSYPNDDPKLGEIYGKLYNFSAVIDPRGLAPKGWHIPSDLEWTILENYLGGVEISAAKLKEKGTLHWLSPNSDATNESGFTALPAGSLDQNGLSAKVGATGCWWTTSRVDELYSFGRMMWYDINGNFISAFPNGNGLSVRCIKDN